MLHLLQGQQVHDGMLDLLQDAHGERPSTPFAPGGALGPMLSASRAAAVLQAKMAGLVGGV